MFKNLTALVAAAAMSAGEPASSTNFYFCSVPSTSPRGRGLILTAVFASQVDDLLFLENSFANYLRSTYAPYGNGWVFPADRVSCVQSEMRERAEELRRALIGKIPQPTETVFQVMFVAG